MLVIPAGSEVSEGRTAKEGGVAMLVSPAGSEVRGTLYMKAPMLVSPAGSEVSARDVQSQPGAAANAGVPRRQQVSARDVQL